MGCFCAGCCYGRETDSFIGVCFPDSVSGLAPDVRVIPTQLIESCANVLVFAALLLITRKKRKGYTSLFIYMMIYAVVRFLIEFLRGDEIRGAYWLFSTSQWISIGLFLLSLTGLAATKRWYEKRPLAPGAIYAGRPYSEIAKIKRMEAAQKELEAEKKPSEGSQFGEVTAPEEAEGDAGGDCGGGGLGD